MYELNPSLNPFCLRCRLEETFIVNLQFRSVTLLVQLNSRDAARRKRRMGEKRVQILRRRDWFLRRCSVSPLLQHLHRRFWLCPCSSGSFFFLPIVSRNIIQCFVSLQWSVVTQMNPSYRPSLMEGKGSETQVLPVSGSDLVLAPSQWSSHVVGMFLFVCSLLCWLWMMWFWFNG